MLIDMVTVSQLVTILLATTIFAAPPSFSESRISRRHKSGPIRRIQSDNRAINRTSHEDYTTNWAGAILDSPTGTYRSVGGVFVAPTPKYPDGSVSAWVGIDGDTCSSGILQTGIDISYSGGAVSYDAWYEWYPDTSYYFNNITIGPGDTIQLTIIAFSDTAGQAVIENQTNGQVVSKLITSTHALCRQNAEWIVEDFLQYTSDGTYSLVPLCDFGTVHFTKTYAQTSSGNTVTPDGAYIVDIQQDGPVLTSTQLESDGITISYIA